MRANLFVVFLILLISGCGGGSSGANGPDPFNPGTDPVVGLSLALLDANCDAVSANTFTTDDTICVQATLTSDGAADSGQVVSFSIDSAIGTLSASTGLTDASGVAQVTLTSTDATAGAATVTATFGSSTANQSFEFTAGAPNATIALDVAVLDTDCQPVTDPVFNTNQSICVRATLTSDDSPLSGEVVNFSLGATIGTLSNTTALTNSEGVAEVTISNADAATGATAVTASFGTTSANANYEYVPSDQAPGAPEIALELIVDGGSGNRFEAGQNVAIRAVFLDADNAPVTDTIINFSVNGGNFTITPADALTDNTGTARSTLLASNTDIGANVLTASGQLNGQTITTTLNFEVLEASGNGGVPQLSLAILNAQCEPEDQSFAANETICLQATLTRNGSPAANEIVSFALSAALGTLSANSALTNAQGIAEVTITNSNASVGAASVTAAFDTISATENYEYVAVDEAVANSPTIDVFITETTNRVTAFRAGQEVLARATVLDPDGQPVEGVIVTFAIQGTGPAVTPATGLTNAQGNTQVNITSSESDVGAYALQASTTVTDIQISNSINFEIQSAGAVVDSVIRFGHFNANNEFVEGLIGSSVADENSMVQISAGATTGFDVALVDENGARIATPTPITFTSTCVSNGQATIDGTVNTINGVASATFEDLSCAGATGNTDQIVASAVINNVTTTIVRDFEIRPEGIGSISFVSATPDSIVLRGTGGQNNASVSTLLFQVNGALGNPLAQQEVSFSLNTTAGGLTIDPVSGLTNSSGQVSTRVTAGTVPTPVRVTATVTPLEGDDIVTQSDLLSVNTGLPDQNSFTLSAANLNPEAADVSGVTVAITARLADAFNNPVPNGTTVNFVTEAGTIDSSCLTGQDQDGVIDPNGPPTGTCSVNWVSSLPIPTDHRNTILAYAIGHETLFDANGNNAYEDTDGGPILNDSDSGFFVTPYGETGFVDMSEAWIDINENRVRDGFEQFVPFNDDGIFNVADGLFNGPQCNSADRCGDQRSIHIRRSLVLITASSDAFWRVYINDVSDDNNIIATNDSRVTITNANANNNIYTLGAGETVTPILVYYDREEQLLPSGTRLGTLDQNGNIASVINTVNNTTRSDSEFVPGSVTVLGNVSTASEFSFAVDVPSGIRTTINFQIAQ